MTQLRKSQSDNARVMKFFRLFRFFKIWRNTFQFVLMMVMSLLVSVALSSSTLSPSVAQSGQDYVIPEPTLQESPTPTPTPLQPIAQPKTKLGHFPYPQADLKTLVTIGRYNSRIEKLAPEASIAWKTMIDAARKEGIVIKPISGFRSIATQSILFQGHIRSRGSQAAAAKSVAPPGYSEHHTGYAIDLGDGRASYTDVTTAFANTKAFRWMIRNADRFGFELSFPIRNFQNIHYEPWHWRFIGSPQARELFASARNQRENLMQIRPKT